MATIGRAIPELVSGIRGAESGTATIYQRNTTTRATWYSDVLLSASASTDISLDSNGGAVVYVVGLVDVVVRDASGTIVRSFTSGGTANAVEVESQSFTGVDYTTGASAADRPLTLEAALDKWKDSSGTTDFKVLVNSVATNLSSFVTSTVGVLYNVKGYGALGDGTTDDTDEIQAAVTAAVAAGGGIVFFPAGTYRITGNVTIAGNVILLGQGAGTPVLQASSPGTYATAIKLDHPSASGIVVSSSKNAGISNITFLNAQANSGSMVYVSDGATARIYACSFYPAYNQSNLIYHTGGAVVTVEDSFLVPRTGYVVNGASTSVATRTHMRGCTILPTLTNNPNMVAGGNVWVEGTKFDLYYANSATSPLISATQAVVTGCEFTQTSAGTVAITAIRSSAVHEGPNVFGTSVAPYDLVAVTSASRCALLSRRTRNLLSTADVSTYAADTIGYGVIGLTRSASTNMTITTQAIPAGEKVLMYVRNNHTATITLNIDAATTAAGSVTCASAATRWWLLESAVVQSAVRWIQIGSSVA